MIIAQCPNGHPLAAGETTCPTCGTFVGNFVSPPVVVMPTVPGYDLLQELGRGGMGVVYKARHQRLNRLVALKMILAGEFASPEDRERFHREAEAVARLQHPNIVQVFEIGEAAGRPFFSLEFVDGTNLSDRLRRSALPPRQAAELLAVLARAVQYAHEQGIIHRDLKPGNILIAGSTALPAGQWLAKITDFGLAKHLNENTQHTRPGAIMGTPNYMAPEQASGSTDRIGPATDIYALGAILYELLTGRPPFVAPSAYETIAQVLGTEPVAVRRLQAKVPRDLEIICLKCLEKVPARRYASARDLADDLHRFLDDVPIVARPVGPIERSLKWARRRPALAALWVGAIVVAAGALTTALLYDRQMQVTRARTHAATLVSALPEIETVALPRLLEDLERYRDWADPLLRDMLDHAAPNSRERLHASLALLAVDPGQATYLGEQILRVDFEKVDVIRTFLQPHRVQVMPALWQALVDGNRGDDRRLHAACALAEYAPEDPRWREVASGLVEALLAAVRRNPAHYPVLAKSLRPVRAELKQPLTVVFGDSERIEIDRSFVTTLLADFHDDRPEVLVELFLEGDEKQMEVLLPRLAGQRTLATRICEAVLQTDPDATAADREREAMRRANAAGGLLFFGSAEAAWPLFRHRPDPSARSFLIQRLRLLGIDPAVLVRRLEVEEEGSARRGLLLALGTFPLAAIQESERDATLRLVHGIFDGDRDAGAHSAAEWILRRWKVGEAQQRGAAAAHSPLRETMRSAWQVNTQGQTMIVLPGPVTFVMGSPTTDPEREGGATSAAERQHRKTIPRSYAIAATEVTVEQFLAFRPQHDYRRDLSPTPQSPINRVTWYQAAAYCNWLSQQENIPEDQWCYVPNSVGRFDDGMTMRPGYLGLRGYRLPTEAEWEYACRAGASTSRYFGDSRKLLPGNVWYTKTSLDRFLLPVGSMPPNDFGLFDMLGNALEWCQDRAALYAPGEDREETGPIFSKESRVLRGASYNDHPQYVRSTHRFPFQPSIVEHSIGFRVVRTIP